MRRLAVVTTIGAVAASSCALGVALGVTWHSRSRTDDRDATAIPIAQITGVQLPNAAILGRPTSEPIRLLREKERGEAEPAFVLTDVRCGRYSGMTAQYHPGVPAAAVKTALSGLYGEEMSGQSGVWRVESQQFSIIVGIEREGFNKGSVRAIFNHFLGPTADPCSAFGDEPAKG
jgi:hypothetical protein